MQSVNISRNLILNARPQSGARRRQSNQIIASSIGTSTTTQSCNKNIDIFASMQPQIEIPYSRVNDELKAIMRNGSLSDEKREDWKKKIDETGTASHLNGNSKIVELLVIGEIVLAVNQIGTCWAFNKCKYPFDYDILILIHSYS